MLAAIGVIALYAELGALVVSGGLVIFSLSAPEAVPASLTLEQAIHAAI